MVLGAPWVWVYVFDHVGHGGQVVYGYTCACILEPDTTGVGGSWPLRPTSRHAHWSRVAQSCLMIRHNFCSWWDIAIVRGRGTIIFLRFEPLLY